MKAARSHACQSPVYTCYHLLPPSCASRCAWAVRRFPRGFSWPPGGLHQPGVSAGGPQCGGLGLATTDLVNARSLIEGRRRAFELAETCETRQAALDPDLRHRDRRDGGSGPLGRRAGGIGRRYQHGLPGQESRQEWRRLGAHVPGRSGRRAGRGGGRRCEHSGDREDAAGLGRPVADRAGPGPRVRAGRRRGRDRPRPDARARISGAVNRAGIAAVVEAVERIPIVANGDIRTIADAAATFQETGCAAISIGRGALANPFIFRQLDCLESNRRPGPGADFRRATRLDGPAFPWPGRPARRALRLLQFRKILKWYFHFTRMPRSLYLRLINLSSPALFDEVVAIAGPPGPNRRCRATMTSTCPFPRERSISGDRSRGESGVCEGGDGFRIRAANRLPRLSWPVIRSLR